MVSSASPSSIYVMLSFFPCLTSPSPHPSHSPTLLPPLQSHIPHLPSLPLPPHHTCTQRHARAPPALVRARGRGRGRSIPEVFHLGFVHSRLEGRLSGLVCLGHLGSPERTRDGSRVFADLDFLVISEDLRSRGGSLSDFVVVSWPQLYRLSPHPSPCLWSQYQGASQRVL